VIRRAINQDEAPLLPQLALEDISAEKEGSLPSNSNLKGFIPKA
jgi:hypothetical protein